MRDGGRGRGGGVGKQLSGVVTEAPLLCCSSMEQVSGEAAGPDEPILGGCVLAGLPPTEAVCWVADGVKEGCHTTEDLHR